MRFLILTLLLGVSVSACTTIDRKDEIGIMPKMTFAQLQPLPVDVEKVVTNTNVPDVQGTNPLQHVSIPKSFEDYAKQRFVGMGGIGAGTMTITLHEASVTRGTENTDNKWTAWTRMDQSDVYTVGIKATFRFDSATGGVFKTATLAQTRGLSIPQRTSLAQRQVLEQEMIEKLIADFDKQVIPALQTQLNVLGAVNTQ